MGETDHNYPRPAAVVGLALVFAILSFMAGCPAPPPSAVIQVPGPTAEAGPTQFARGGQVVTLDGTGSLGPNEQPILYTWTQISGPPVILNGPNTATPTFTAPTTPSVLTFQLAVSDPIATGTTDSVSILVDIPPSTLFVTNLGNSSVTSYANPVIVAGDNTSTTTLTGPGTQLSTPTDLVVATDGSLLVNNSTAGVTTTLPGITIYDNATTVGGNTSPSRFVAGSQTGLTAALAMAFDPTRDLLFVSNVDNVSRILAFGNVSTVAFNGNVAPVRTITSTGVLNSPVGINLDSRGDLYVANQGANNVLVYANAGTLDGDVVPSRTITSGAFSNVFDVWVDADDTLYVLRNGDPPGVLVFPSAAGLNGSAEPPGTITIPGAGFLTSITVGSNGTGYIVDNSRNAIYVVDAIATRTGTINPDRTIQGPRTGLDSPIRLFLREQPEGLPPKARGPLDAR